MTSIARTLLVSLLAGIPAAMACGAQPGGGGGQAQGQPMVGRVPYEKKATRGETYAHMLSKLQPSNARWSDFHMLTGFPFKGFKQNQLAQPWPPEDELPKMAHGGPGPDLTKTYTGKDEVQVAWKAIGDIQSLKVDFKGKDDRLNNFACGYLYGTVTVDQATTIEVPMGSDDGMRLWLNGRLILDKDMPRSLDPTEDKVTFDLKPGANHVFIKVSQGQGGFEFQMMNRQPLSPDVDAALQYYLEGDFPSTPEAAYYRAITIPVPENVVLEVGGLDTLPDGRPVVSTRRGEVYIVDGAYDDPPVNARFNRFAFGLHEPLGLAVRLEKDGKGQEQTAVYCVQRGELTRLIDRTGDGQADEYMTVTDGWGVSGNYHEFAFGPKFDPAGNAWVTLNVGFCGSLGKALVPYRGWAIRVKPDGTFEPWCDGLRSPNGIGFWTNGEPFYVDNQGDYVGTCRMTHLAKDSWAGHPASARWRGDFKQGELPAKRERAVLWFPYPEMGQSTADILLYDPLRNEGSRATPATPGMASPEFGPFEGQFFFGDQTLCLVVRGDIEQVGDVYQGACFPFRSALDCGVNRICWGKDKSMFVGQTDRGWGSIGRLRYGLQRIVWSGQTPFECKTMRVQPDGFVVTFTEPVDPKTMANPASYAMESWTYKYFATYGSPEVEKQPCKVLSATPIDATSVKLTIEGLRAGGEGYVHHLRMPGIRNASGAELLHPDAYYTLQRLPSGVN